MQDKDIAKDKALLGELKGYWDLCIAAYAKHHKKMRVLDATDRGKLWKALKTKFPSYQILPDTNFVSYVKSNTVASIYTVTKAADILPTSENDKQLTTNLNIALDCIWSLANIGYAQYQAGDRAALLNLGITQVGWDDTLTGGNVTDNNYYKGNVTVKNVDPIKFMRDPYADSFENAGYCMVYDSYHKSVIQKNPNYSEAFKEYCEKQTQSTNIDLPRNTAQQNPTGQKDYYNIITYWVKRADDKVDEIHVIDNEHILYKKENIYPATFPFALLYCELPAGDLIGTSPCAKIFPNNVAYNLMDSIALTAEYKNQRPPKFVTSASGLNINSFAKHGDEADKTFIVNGDASKAVHYHQFPATSPNLQYIKTGLENGIQTISGVDGRYTGRDTGSIITTGGTEEMLNRVTLCDTPKIMNFEAYAKRLTQLVLSNFIHNSAERSFYYQEPNTTKWKSVTLDFPQIDDKTLFNYQIAISSELPKNRQRIASVANMLMEKQMQYNQQGTQVQLITEEEWLMFQDLPNKELMLERMGIQRMQDVTAEVAQVLYDYAGLIENGITPNDALMATAQHLKDTRSGLAPEASMDPSVNGTLEQNQMMAEPIL